MTKKNFQNIANEAMKVNNLETVHVASDGQAFGNIADCKNHCRANELEYQTYGVVADDAPATNMELVQELADVRDELAMAKTAIDTQKATIADLEARPTVEKANEVAEALEEAQGRLATEQQDNSKLRKALSAAKAPKQKNKK